MNDKHSEIKYVVMDPSKNITILVTNEVLDSDYKLVAKKLLELESNAEQVGFLQYNDESDITLNMAGNEFCGNATMSAAVYFGIEKKLNDAKVVVKSSGEDELINVYIKKESRRAKPVTIDDEKVSGELDVKINDDEWEGTVEMPKPLIIKEVDFGNGERYSVVFFEGIAHVIIDKSSWARVARPYDGNREVHSHDESETRLYLEKKIKEWCEFLGVPAIGIMLCDNIDDIKKSQNFDVAQVKITPLVYVKSIDTLYWESSCASGTTAVGAYVADVMNHNGKINVRQPSGTILSIEKTVDGKLLLAGKVKLLYKKSVMI